MDKNVDNFRKTLVIHNKYNPPDKFALDLPVIHEVDEHLTPSEESHAIVLSPLCLLHMCEMRYICSICSGRLTVSVPCVNR